MGVGEHTCGEHVVIGCNNLPSIGIVIPALISMQDRDGDEKRPVRIGSDIDINNVSLPSARGKSEG